jgi:hypothetical protein
MELPELISQGLQRLQQGQMQQGAFDVEAHHRNMLETGPFAEAKKRHAVWTQGSLRDEQAAVAQAAVEADSEFPIVRALAWSDLKYGMEKSRGNFDAAMRHAGLGQPKKRQ